MIGRCCLVGFALVGSASCSLGTTPPDTQPPLVQITSPTAGATVTGPVTIEAVAVDDDAVDRVRFLVDGNLLREVFTAPYSVMWNTGLYSNNSVHKIRVEALDFSKNVGADSISVTVQNTPTRARPGLTP